MKSVSQNHKKLKKRALRHNIWLNLRIILTNYSHLLAQMCLKQQWLQI